MCHIQCSIVVAIVLLTAVVPSSVLAADLPTVIPDAVAFFKPTGRLIRVPVTIADKTYLFALDTGSSVTVVDTLLQPLLGRVLAYQVADAGIGEVVLALHESPELRIGDAKRFEMKVPAVGLIASADLSILRKRSDRDIYGILGMDLMRNWVVMVSFRKEIGLVGIWRGQPRSSEINGRQVPIHFTRSGCPQVHAKITGGQEQLFLVDTGMEFSVCLPREQYDQQIMSGKLRQTNTASAFTLGGELEEGLARPLSLELSGFKHPDLVVMCFNEASLGLTYWQRYRVVFDFPGRTMLLANSDSYAYPDVSDRGGIRVERKNGNCVFFAAPDSWGYQAGIRDGDLVTSVNGVSALEAGGGVERSLELNNIGHIRLTIQRDNSEHHIVLPRPWSEDARGDK